LGDTGETPVSLPCVPDFGLEVPEVPGRTATAEAASSLLPPATRVGAVAPELLCRLFWAMALSTSVLRADAAFLRRMQKNTATPTRTTTARPPMTPPTISPMFGFVSEPLPPLVELPVLLPFEPPFEPPLLPPLLPEIPVCEGPEPPMPPGPLVCAVVATVMPLARRILEKSLQPQCTYRTRLPMVIPHP